MNPTIIVDAGQRTTEFEQYIHAHPVVSLIVGIIVCSWLVTGIIVPWLPKKKNIRRALMTIDALIAAGLTGAIFYDQFAWPIVGLLCLLVGAGSPFVYRFLAIWICKWKPGMRKFLVLPELADPEPDSTDQAGI